MKAAPARNVADGPTTSHSSPAITLASKSATPLARLKNPNAVPRSLIGAVSATSAEEPLGHPHVQPPQTDSNKHGPDAGREGQNEIGQDEHHETRAEHQPSIISIRQDPHRVGRRGVEDVHDHQDQRYDTERQAAQTFGSQDQECFAEPGER